MPAKESRSTAPTSEIAVTPLLGYPTPFQISGSIALFDDGYLDLGVGVDVPMLYSARVGLHYEVARSVGASETTEVSLSGYAGTMTLLSLAGANAVTVSGELGGALRFRWWCWDTVGLVGIANLGFAARKRTEGMTGIPTFSLTVGLAFRDPVGRKR